MKHLGFCRPLVAVALLSLISCSGDEGNTARGTLVDEYGAEIQKVLSSDPVVMTLQDLEPNTQYRIHVKDPQDKALSPEGGFIASSDEEGRIPASTIIQNLEILDLVAATKLGRNLKLAELMQTDRSGTYRIEVTEMSGGRVLEATFDVTDASSVACGDSDGVVRASFSSSEHVFVMLEKGSGNLQDGTYSCYVRSDTNGVLEDGDNLLGQVAAVTVSSGKGKADLGLFGLGSYDVVCDLNGDHKYTRGTDLISRARRYHPCFTIQAKNNNRDIIGQVCSDRNGNYRDVFDPSAKDENIRDVFAWIAPVEQSLVEETLGVRKYVVAHKEVWMDGEALNDVTAGEGQSAFEVDPVQGFCTNESPWLVWPRELMVAGCYDCIIDVNANGLYDRGIDLLDNIDHLGNPSTCGMRVMSSACQNRLTIASHVDGASVDATAIELVGSLSEAAQSASVTVASGQSSNTINLETSGNSFSAAIPLFSGENFVTVSAVFDDDLTCGKTLTITSTAQASTSELFRVQLTWDGDTDMDLHLVRPGGAYAEGGGGVDDCNYQNCRVGLEGTSPNDIDWGAVGEIDDPKLDVDCIACGNGIENIWMNAITQDGDYKVYVDAYDGSESVVNVTLFILGQNVGSVACGAMESDTSNDSCFVGTLSWAGGSTGNGSFTPSGIKAANF